MSGLAVQAVTRRFGSLAVLNGVSLEAPPGRVTALIGQNGAGKSTLFRIVMGLLRPGSGTVTVDGRDALAVPFHRKRSLGLGYLAQEPGSFPELTVRENLELIVELVVPSRAERAGTTETLLRRTGLDGAAGRTFKVLSGGEQRRLEIAKVLALEPRTLLLDEPFSGLDPMIVQGLAALLRELADEGVGILLTDHNVHMTLPHADHAYVLAGGVVVCEGSPRDVASHEQARRLYFGDAFVLGS